MREPLAQEQSHQVSDSVGNGSANGGSAVAQQPRVQSVARAAEILNHVATSPSGLTTKALSGRLGVSMPTMYRLTQTLCAVGLLRRDAVRRVFVVGLQVGVLADGLSRHFDVRTELLTCVQSAAERTGECAYGCGWLNDEIVVLTSARGTHPISVAESPLGQAKAAHARASGKLMLALAPEERRERYLATHPPRRYTDRTMTGAELREDFARISDRRYATDEEEHGEGVCCLAVPLDSDGAQIVAIAAPAERFRANFESLLEGLRSAASRFYLQ